MAYILQDGKYVPVTGRAENATIGTGNNVNPFPTPELLYTL